MTKPILVIGDDPVLLAQIDMLLTSAGYSIITLTHTNYEPAAAHNAQAILVVVDRTPGDDITIWQTVQRMRLDRIMTRLPLIVCTDLEPDDGETSYYQRRRITFVHKPFEDGDLLGVVKATLSNIPAQPEGPNKVSLAALVQGGAKAGGGR